MTIQDLPVILASGSPRRMEMLADAGADFIVYKADCGEDIHTELTPEETVMALSLRKNIAAENSIAKEDAAEGDLKRILQGDYLLISGDTIVYANGEILGKPESQEDAFRMLHSMKNKKHSVFSGVCIKRKNSPDRIVFCEKTDVYFKDYSDEYLREYVASGEPMDKAGGYAIQGVFGENVDHIEGPKDNVIGFPMEKIIKVLSEISL